MWKGKGGGPKSRRGLVRVRMKKTQQKRGN